MFEFRVDIAVQPRTGLQALHRLAADDKPLADIAPETDDFPVPVHESEAVAVMEQEGGIRRLHRHDPVSDGSDRADVLAHGLGGFHRGPGTAPPVQEKFRIVPVEGLPKVGRETAPDRSERTAAIFVRVTADQGVQRLGIGPDDVPDIGYALETALDLERVRTGLGQVLQAVDQVEILQRKQRLVPDQDMPFPVLQVIERPAGLDAGAPVRAPPRKVLREIALSAVTDAEGAMDKAFQLRPDRLPDGTDLIQREFPLQHQPPVSQALGEAGLFRRLDGALGGSVEDHSLRGQPRHGRILDDEGIHPGIGEFLQETPRLRDFLLIDQRVESHVDPGAELMRIVAETADVLHGIPGRLPCPEGRAGDIDGIGTAVDGCHADFCRTGRREKLEGTHAISYRR